MTYERSKGRSSKNPFVMLPHRIMECANYKKLSSYAVKLLLDFIYQHRKGNNGDLMAAFSVLKTRGWRSPGTLSKSIKELQYYGFIQITRQGGKHCASLYALTWIGIDECKGKIDISPCRAPSNLWQVERDKFVHIKPEKNKKRSRQVYQSSRNVYQLTKKGA